jgi:hypothetical protein
MSSGPAGSSIVNLILAIGAAARLTRLVTIDTITAPLRARVMKATGDPDHPVSVLMRCPWCMGVWISGPVAAWAYFTWGHWWFTVPALALTCAHAAGYAATRE